MDINQLKTFYHVAKNASFTKAAYKLCITQPAVTSQIKSLEENLRTCLFQRIGRKIFLTHEGKILLEYARKVINLEKEIKTIFTELSGLQKGKIILGATRVIGTYFLPQKLGQFRAKYPQIEILTRIENSTQVMNFLLEGEVDLAISGKTDDLNKNLEARLYHTEKLVLITSLQSKIAKEQKISLEKLSNYQFFFREEGTKTRQITDEWIKANSVFNNTSFEVGNVEAVKRLVEEDFGITLIPEIAVKREVELGLIKIIDIPELDLKIDYYLMYIKDRKFSKTISTFTDFLFPKPVKH